MKRPQRLPAWVLATALAAAGCASGPDYASIYVTSQPPPPKRVHRPAPPPSPLHIWIEGRWAWSGSDWIWVSGRYTHPPHPRARWRPGRWAKRGHGWAWVPGYWVRR